MKRIGSATVLCALSLLAHGPGYVHAESIDVPRYGVHEIVFEGPAAEATDCPVRDVELVTTWRYEGGAAELKVWGFWDGDGQGGERGNIYKVRFCPIEAGTWKLVRTQSNREELSGQKEGFKVRCVASRHPGFWVPDRQTGGRWYKRQDGSHPYVIGDTLYSFLSEYRDNGPSGGNIRDDVVNTSRYFKKTRFSLTGDRYPHPVVKPFLDDNGRATDAGGYCHRPNPAWFFGRVDTAVRTAFEQDMIADLILNGPDTFASRSILKAEKNGGDARPFLRYIAARYGSFPNVWICLANEYDIKEPSYSPGEIVRFGRTMRQFLPYPTPMSVHSRPRDWNRELNAEPWHDHVIIQKKLKKLADAADWVARNHSIGGDQPVIDDELAYEGAGDGWSEGDVIESHLGAFLGGGYGTTGHKPAGKQGHYFWGNFKADEHHSADNLQWLRVQIDGNITFWKMRPVSANADRRQRGIFHEVDNEFRAMEWPGREYVLGANRAFRNIEARLPRGRWAVTRYDVISKTRSILAEDVEQTFRFDAPESRAVLFHFGNTGVSDGAQ